MLHRILTEEPLFLLNIPFSQLVPRKVSIHSFGDIEKMQKCVPPAIIPGASDGMIKRCKIQVDIYSRMNNFVGNQLD